MDRNNNEMQSVMNLLVKQVMQKYGVDANSIQVSDEQKKEIREMVSSLQKEVEKLEQQNNSVAENSNNEENSENNSSKNKIRRNKSRLGRRSNN
uniref:hypothetical protein n=1 Tax=Bacillaceae bacterium JMAK1 TaxID=1028381 RepID=UPI0003ABE891|nr:hypothetical protein [Bacillaceae bacterium JMAK1]AGQ45438.1 hypothetical protein [Bacillaceae bacterium JMAK1]